MPKRNAMIPNAHFHKDWQNRVKCWFNQAARKKRRAQKRAVKAKLIAPRPIAGSLRPVVRCQTNRYNSKQRLGRGFSVVELKTIGLSVGFARSVGISVDRRRKNRSEEGLQANIARLREYRSRLILFPKGNKPMKGDSTAEECKNVTQFTGPLQRLTRVSKKAAREQSAVISKEMADFNAFEYLSKERKDKKLRGKREETAKLKKEAEAANLPKQK